MDDKPQLRIPDRFGIYPWWPQNGVGWIHPDDVTLAQQMIPGNWIFRRDYVDQNYSRLTYGDRKIRVKPTMWLEVTTDGYLVGDRVEIRSQMGRRTPMIATIRHMLWNRQSQVVDYVLSANHKRLPGTFQVEDFQPALELDQPMSVRLAELASRSRIR